MKKIVTEMIDEIRKMKYDYLFWNAERTFTTRQLLLINTRNCEKGNLMTEEERKEYWRVIYDIICLILRKHKVQRGSEEIWLLVGFGALFIFWPLLKLRERTVVFWEKAKHMRGLLEQFLDRHYPRWRELHALPSHQVMAGRDSLSIRYQLHALITFTPHEQGSEYVRLDEVVKWALLAGVRRDAIIKKLQKLPKVRQ